MTKKNMPRTANMVEGMPSSILIGHVMWKFLLNDLLFISMPEEAFVIDGLPSETGILVGSKRWMGHGLICNEYLFLLLCNGRQLHRDPSVLFAGYKLPHPLQYKIVVKVKGFVSHYSLYLNFSVSLGVF